MGSTAEGLLVTEDAAALVEHAAGVFVFLTIFGDVFFGVAILNKLRFLDCLMTEYSGKYYCMLINCLLAWFGTTGYLC